MEPATSIQSSPIQIEVGTSSGQRNRRPKARRGNRGNASLGMRPASIVYERRNQAAEPLNSADTSGTAPHVPGAPISRGLGHRRGRNVRPVEERNVNGRQFGGHLTQEALSSAQASPLYTQLQEDAIVSVPGQEVTPGRNGSERNQPRKPHRDRQRRFSKSQAPDIATRTHEDIDCGNYECPICTSEVRRNSKVWSCHTCWTVFHLACIKKWSTNEGAATQPNAQNGQPPPPRQWRCPGCNLPKDELPKSYACWCGKELEPKSLAGLPPHSCGNTCGKERARKCPHPCQLTCHAGPCPPCAHMGPVQICFCGKHEVTKRCSDTDYEGGWSCGEICAEVMPCGEHNCSRPCHEGLCGACEVRVHARCYCGQVEKDVLCSERGEEVSSHRTHLENGIEIVNEDFIGSFDCGNLCGRKFDCGEHQCERPCHAQSVKAEHCPRSPDMVSDCPCGKTPLHELTEKPRERCTDPIAHCGRQCGKLLPCGHEDERICHTGTCMPCTKTVEIRCRCGRTTSRTVCHQGKEELPQCARTCKVLLNCGRHNCDERCCPGERKAAERQSIKRKQRPLGSTQRAVDDGFEAEHICTMQCGRLLKCGIHVCEDLCHRGACGTCREAIFEELSCHCGKTVLQPPLPCGTKPPPCRYACHRPKVCGHPQVAHNCHLDDEACPKCPFLTEKRCMCGKKSLKNQPCWLQDVRCGDVCGRQLKCGSHFCRKPCHRPGECEDSYGEPCRQPCGKAKKACGHPDIENTCHAPFPCKEDKPCQSKIFITCDCQAQKQEMKCGASKSTEGNSSKTLPCNDECARLERNRKLALALDIDQSSHVEGGDHIPFSTETLDLFAQHPKWGQNQEREFRVFASDVDEKRLRFKPMRAGERAFVHALAEDFGFDSESMDPEPHRHVMIWKTPRFVSAPNKTLADALRIRRAQHSINASANVSDNESSAKPPKPNAWASEPFNAFVIGDPRFGLTVDELRGEVNALLQPDTPFTVDIEFLPNEQVLLKAISHSLTGPGLHQVLQNIKAPLVSAMTSKKYGTPELCATDTSLNILRRESDSVAGDGWSKVAAKKAAPKTTVSYNGTAASNAFAALSNNKVTFSKKTPTKPKPKPKPTQAIVVDDWEAAERAEEEKDNVASGASGDERQTGAPVIADESVVGPDERGLGEVANTSADPVVGGSDHEAPHEENYLRKGEGES